MLHFNTTNIKKIGLNESIFSLLATSFSILFGLLCIIPFWLVLINSFSDSSVLSIEGFKLLPSKFSLDAYRTLFEGTQIYTSYGVSIFVTVVGTSIGTIISAMYAYSLSHKRVKYGNILSFLTYFTMIMGSGLVGFYILIAQWLHLKDNIFAMILPSLLNPFYVFVMMSFFRALPYEIYESATVDGANDIWIFFRIILPISKPVLACIVLFYALQYWNDWYLALLFINDKNLNPLQIMIKRVIEMSNLSNYINSKVAYIPNVPIESIKLSTTVVTIGPIIFMYPFLQRYFVMGMTIGAVKG